MASQMWQLGAFVVVGCVVVVNGFAINGVDTRAQCWTDGNDEPTARWWNDGDEIVRGRYVYKCEQGRLAAVGCINDAGDRVLKGRSFVADGFEYRCVQDTEGYLFFESTACVTADGARHRPGDTWDHLDGKAYWFTCMREYYNEGETDGPSYLSVKTQGCLVGDSKRRIVIGDTIEDGDSWYECQDRFDSTLLCLKGCVYEGRRLKSGETWEEGEYVYTCVKQADRAIVECTGCFENGRRLRSGERYWRGDQVLQCNIMFDQTSRRVTRSRKTVGCLEKRRQTNGQLQYVERNIGCRWYEDSADEQCRFERHCRRDGVAEGVGCVYKKNGVPYLWLSKNTYTTYAAPDGIVHRVACAVDENQNVSYFLFDESDLGPNGKLARAGIQYTAPRG